MISWPLGLLQMFKVPFKLLLVRCRDQVLPGFMAWEEGQGALGGSGAVPALSCHP